MQAERKPEPPRAVAPLIVVRLRRPPRSVDEVWLHPSALEQRLVIHRYAEDHGYPLVPGLAVLRVKGRRHSFKREHKLKNAIDIALAKRLALLMDDVFRLIAGMGAEDAIGFIDELRRSRAPIYSIRHGKMITHMPYETIRSNVRLHEALLRKHSERTKRGLAIFARESLTPPSEAMKRSAESRGRIADSRARRLHEEIEKVRAELPEAERNNRSAIARALNAAGIAGPGGGKWQGTTVKRIEERVAKLASDE